MSRRNNFDLIRLLAALQVVVWHSGHYLGLHVLPRPLFDVIKYFPGVPIFFVISGFLVFAAYDRNKNIFQYYRNRILRIFPALWVAFFILFGIIYFFGHRADTPGELIRWVGAQLTVFQNYVPEGIREYTHHSPNPALWTIPIEFSFYIIVPVLFWIVKKTRFLNMTALVVSLMVLSYAFNYYLFTIKGVNQRLFSILDDNLLPYLFYFLVGVVSYIHFDKLKRFYVGKAGYWLAIYVGYVFVIGAQLDLYEQSYFMNGFGLIGELILAQLVISAGYTYPNVSHKILHGTDISYGVYLYHMIVINLFNKYGYYGADNTFWPIVGLTITAAALSWIFVEKPSLSLKNRPLPGFLLNSRSAGS